MENATKALLIAAGMLMAIMILSLLLIGYNEISNYYNERHKNAVVQQTIEFNNKFENYNREKIRGSDMISLMNRIIDYNEREHFQEGTKYKRIMVNIDIGATFLNQFKYQDSGETIISAQITNAGGNERIDDKKLIAITNIESTLINQAYSWGFGSLTSGQLQKLSANISNIMIDETSTEPRAIRNRIKRKELIHSIFKINIDVNENAVTKTSYISRVNQIKEIALKYYQYMQFKRAYFDCTEAIYDENTGRVCEMNFKIRTDSNGNVEFN